MKMLIKEVIYHEVDMDVEDFREWMQKENIMDEYPMTLDVLFERIARGQIELSWDDVMYGYHELSISALSEEVSKRHGERADHRRLNAIYISVDSSINEITFEGNWKVGDFALLTTDEVKELEDHLGIEILNNAGVPRPKLKEIKKMEDE